MGLFKNVIEPASIALAFTAGTLINRRRLKPQRYQRDLESIPDYISAEKKTDDASSASHRKGSNSSNKGGSNSLVFRVLSWIYGTFPFLSEIWYWLLTYWVYQLSRAFTARAIAPYPQIYLVAKQHALQLLAIEEFLHIDFEQAFQEYILTKHAYIMPLLRHIYHSHIIIGVVFIVYIYTFLPPPLFRRIRRTIAMDNFIAFIIISLWRCYPPRMLPPEYGFIDILHEGKTGSVWTHNRFRLTIAAMPSLHFGTSVLFAVCLARFSPHLVMRVLAPLWPVAMFVTVVATANHFVLDIVVGAIIPLLGWRWNRAILVLEGVQEWVFSPVIERMDWSFGGEARREVER
ncbi:PAP2 superfamily-domain-containing protein [Trichoderma sp. SZMC 28011]